MKTEMKTEWTNEHDQAYQALDWKYLAWEAFEVLGPEACQKAIEHGAPLVVDPEDGGFRLGDDGQRSLESKLAGFSMENSNVPLEELCARFRQLALQDATAALKKIRRADLGKQGIHMLPGGIDMRSPGDLTTAH